MLPTKFGSVQTRRSIQNVLLIGATSAMARALAHRLCAQGCRLILAGRDVEELTKDKNDLRIRYQTEIFVEPFEALEPASHSALIERCIQIFGGQLEVVVICHGFLPDAAAVNQDVEEARRTIEINFTSVVSLLIPIANHFESKKSGLIAVISSVAGDRGRQSNYAYGAAKAGVSAYLQGLRNRLHASGVQVVDVKPGMVQTPMTHGICNPNSPLVAAPDRVARDIDRAIRKCKSTVYTPWFWRPIMQVIRLLPEPIFNRLRL